MENGEKINISDNVDRSSMTIYEPQDFMLPK